MKRIIIVLAILAVAGLGAFRAAQVISAKKEDPKKGMQGQAPMVEVAPVTQGLIEEKMLRTGDIAPQFSGDDLFQSPGVGGEDQRPRGRPGESR